MAKKTTKKKTLSRSLGKARATKQDEFYTQLPDIEKELRHYTKHFREKTVLCNCDDPRVSNFFHYFTFNFQKLGLKKLITTCYQNRDATLFSEHEDKHGLVLEYTGPPEGEPDKVPAPEDVGLRELEGDGDFRSSECVELLKQADIVVTNPPFSLYRKYVEHLMEYNKQFVIIGNHNAITYREIFNFIKANQLWLGNSAPTAFRVPDHYEMRKTRSWRDEDGNNWRSLGNACWFTNLDIAKRHESIPLFEKYRKDEYEDFDNYDAINVPRVAHIPENYTGVMGVPITFLNKFNPKQFEIVGLIAGNIKGLAGIPSSTGKDGPYINGKLKYGRILIRRK
ncbi:MAG: modification methylase [Phycisphaera sp.]|nr:MAG: modification methylase [Phycisphaera sp.]